MPKNICIDCGYFLNCNKAEENKTECEKFIKVHREIRRVEDAENNKQ